MCIPTLRNTRHQNRHPSIWAHTLEGKSYLEGTGFLLALTILVASGTNVVLLSLTLKQQLPLT